MPDNQDNIKAGTKRLQWLRLYTETLNDPKVQRLPPHTFKTWINLLCLAAEANGNLPSVDDMAFSLRLSASEMQSHIDELINVGLIDIDPHKKLSPHNWGSRQFRSDSDPTATARKRKQRAKEKETKPKVSTMSRVTNENVTRTEQSRAESEQIQSRAEKPPKPPSGGADDQPENDLIENQNAMAAALTANQWQPPGIEFQNGKLEMFNGTRQLWTEKLGSGEALDLALIEIQAEIESSRSRTPLAARVEAALARRARTKLDQDQRYASAAKRRETPKKSNDGSRMAAYLASCEGASA